MRKRSIAIFIVVLFLMGGMMLRMYDLTGQMLSQAADQQEGMAVTVSNARGTIYDCQLRPLVNSETEYKASVTANPKAIAALSGCLDSEALESLSQKLEDGKPVVTVLNSLPVPASGLTLFQVPVRYSGRTLAPHVVGYLDGDGLHGATGAEQVFDDLLTSDSGKASVTYTVDAVGKPLEGIDPVLSDTTANAKAGVVLTIDEDIQKIAEDAAKAHMTKGAVVVMEPSTGRISAMVSLPDYQPTNVADCLDDADSPLMNRALCDYNVGSVFKIVTTAAALEAGISTDTAFTCTGSIEVGDVNFHCHDRLGHGTLTMKEAFAQSCNPYFIQLGLKVGGTKLYNMAVALGFDRPILLADGWKTARATLPSETELLSPAAVANLAFGQGSLTASPVHIAQLVAAVVNGGNIVRPTLYKGTVDAAGNLTEESPAPSESCFSAGTAKILRQMMEYAVQEGTGASACPSEGGAGGKTGTAETGWYVNDQEVVQSWFAGYYPEKDPKYVIVVLAEDTNGTGGKSNPVFKQICDQIDILESVKEKSAGQ